MFAFVHVFAPDLVKFNTNDIMITNNIIGYTNYIGLGKCVIKQLFYHIWYVNDE